MGRHLSAGAAGLLFGLGLAVSQMVDPAKVLGFLDMAGAWDPSLAFVMGGAVSVCLITFRLVDRRAAPIFGSGFTRMSAGGLDRRLIGGSLLFGVGWGLVGFCPGPAVTSLAYGKTESLIFVAAMLVGAGIHNLVPGVGRAAPATGEV